MENRKIPNEFLGVVMSETNELFATVNYIKSKVDTLEKIELFRMREDQEQKQKYLDFLNLMRH